MHYLGSNQGTFKIDQHGVIEVEEGTLGLEGGTGRDVGQLNQQRDPFSTRFQGPGDPVDRDARLPATGCLQV